MCTIRAILHSQPLLYQTDGWTQSAMVGACMAQSTLQQSSHRIVLAETRSPWKWHRLGIQPHGYSPLARRNIPFGISHPDFAWSPEIHRQCRSRGRFRRMRKCACRLGRIQCHRTTRLPNPRQVPAPKSLRPPPDLFALRASARPISQNSRYSR